MNYLRNYVKVIRYSETSNHMLAEIASDPEHLKPGSNARLVAADLMQEEGREDEEKALRSPHPITIEKGRVYTGLPIQIQFFKDGIREAIERHVLLDHNLAVWDNLDFLDNYHPDLQKKIDEDARLFLNNLYEHIRTNLFGSTALRFHDARNNRITRNYHSFTEPYNMEAFNDFAKKRGPLKVKVVNNVLHEDKSDQ